MSQVFIYNVRDSLGRMHVGEIEADTRELVVERLRQSGYFVTKVESKASSPTVEQSIVLFDRVTARDLSVLFRQFSTMIAAGMPLLKSLSVLAQQSEKKKLKITLETIRRDVETGSSLSQAVGRHINIFPPFVVAMIRTGESGGVLDTIMDRLAIHFENEHEVQQKVKSALRYPVIVLSFSVLVVIFMLTFIVPRFLDMFTSMNMEMPLPTRIIMGVSVFMQNYYLVILSCIILLGLLVKRYSKTSSGRVVMDRLLLKVPVFGDLILKSALAKCTRSLGTLLASGVPIIQAIDITKDIAGNEIIARELGEASGMIRDGETMSRKLEQSKLFPPLMVGMIAIGEETGGLESMLMKIADFYDREVKYLTENLTALIEPFLIAFLGFVIGGILLSILLPIFDVYGNIGNTM